MNKLIKSIACLMFASLLFVSPITLAVDENVSNASEPNGYNNSLNAIGLDFETYSSMPAEKRQYYANFEAVCVSTQTRYFRVEDNSPNENNEAAVCSSGTYQDGFIELSAEQFAAELTQNFGTPNIKEAQTAVRRKIDSKVYTKSSSDSDTSSTSWVTVTTSLSYGGNDRWVLSNDVTYLAVNALGCPVSTHAIGLGVNPQFSIVPGSDYCVRNYDSLITDPYIYTPGLKNYYDSDYRGANGYALSFKVYSNELNNNIYYVVAVRPNNSSAIVVDGYGNYAKRTASVEFGLSISETGVGMNISPSTNVQRMPNTHVQVYR